MRRSRLGTALAALALAACVDSQAPDNSPSKPTTPDQSLPVLGTMQTVKVSTGTDGFKIDLRFVTPATTAQKAFFEIAAARWQSIITGDVPNTTGSIPAQGCGNNFPTPPYQGGLDDVLIDVVLVPIDGPGAVLGAAGPCLIRNEDDLTVYGIMMFDTADLAFMAGQGIFDEVVVHEMGHVLGIGTLWNFRRSLLTSSLTDPRFIGPNGIAGYRAVGGASSAIPVEEGGGPGTARGHWDEESFDTELMTGFIGRRAPLSIMTIASMADLGYVVNKAAADEYKIRGQERDEEPAAAGEQLVNLAAGMKLVKPIGVVK
jgi:hypothetical protein